MTSERASFLWLLALRGYWLQALEDELSGFPPEILAAATKLAAETSALELLRSVQALKGIFEMEGRLVAREAAFRRNYAIGSMLGLDVRDPNMRLWAGEDVRAIFGL